MTAAVNLFKHLDDVIAFLPGNPKVNPVVRQFNKFRRTYDNILTKEEQDETWIRCWEKHSKIFTNPKGYKVEDMTIFVEYDREIRIGISSFYRYALNTMESTQKELEGLGNAAAVGRLELVGPDMLELNLFRCMRACYEKQDELDLLIRQIEQDLGGDVTASANKNPVQPAASTSPFEGISKHPMMAQLFDVAKQLFNTNDPNGNPMDKIQGILGDKEKMGKFQAALGGMGSASPQDMMSRFKSMAEDEELRGIAKSIMDPLIPPEISAQLISQMHATMDQNEPGAADDIPTVESGETFLEDGGTFLVRGSDQMDMDSWIEETVSKC